MTSRSNWWILFVTTSATALVFLDQTVMPIALPAIQKQFALTHVDLMWVVNIYLLMVIGLLLVAGRMADLFGKKKIYMLGLSLSAVASLIAAFSHSVFSLFIARAIQGAGAAMILPTTSALLISTFPPDRRARAIGINTGISALFLALGPVVGGIFTQYISWRMIFIAYLPITFFSMGMCFLLIKEKHEKREERFHFAGACTLILSVTMLVIALMQGSQWGWSSWPILLCLFITPIAGACFVVLSLRNVHPLLDFRIFKIVPFSGAIVAIFLTQMMIAVTVFWALYFQNDLGYSPAKTGFVILIATFPVLITAPLSGVLADRYGAKRPMTMGFLILIFALAWVAFMGLKKNVGLLAPGLLGFGLGIPMIFSPAIALALSHVPSSQLGSSAAITTAARQLAATMGIAVMTALFQSIVEHTHSQTDAFAGVSLLASLFALAGLTLVLFVLPRQGAESGKGNR